MQGEHEWHTGSLLLPSSTLPLSPILLLLPTTTSLRPLRPSSHVRMHEKHYWGAAHGLAGIAHTLLLGAWHMGHLGQVGRVGEVAAAEAEEGAGEEGREAAEEGGREAVAVLEWMVGGRLPSGNYPSSEEKRLTAAAVAGGGGAADGGAGGGGVEGGARKAAAGGADRLVQWCHGAPGVAMALALAATVCAVRVPCMCSPDGSSGGSGRGGVAAGEVVWQRGLLREMGLCHGIAGNAYAFLSLHRANSALHATGNGETDSMQETTTPALPPPSTHLHRARAFAAFLLAHRLPAGPPPAPRRCRPATLRQPPLLPHGGPGRRRLSLPGHGPA
ncbi:unnamed protein product [Closterium sp. NIES-53]